MIGTSLRGDAGPGSTAMYSRRDLYDKVPVVQVDIRLPFIRERLKFHYFIDFLLLDYYKKKISKKIITKSSEKIINFCCYSVMQVQVVYNTNDDIVDDIISSAIIK